MGRGGLWCAVVRTEHGVWFPQGQAAENPGMCGTLTGAGRCPVQQDQQKRNRILDQDLSEQDDGPVAPGSQKTRRLVPSCWATGMNTVHRSGAQARLHPKMEMQERRREVEGLRGAGFATLRKNSRIPPHS